MLNTCGGLGTAGEAVLHMIVEYVVHAYERVSHDFHVEQKMRHDNEEKNN